MGLKRVKERCTVNGVLCDQRPSPLRPLGLAVGATGGMMCLPYVAVVAVACNWPERDVQQILFLHTMVVNSHI
jgi:hypothetical protein